MLGGRWLVQRGQRVAVLLTALHRNEEHWGGRWGSPHEFNPERFMPGVCWGEGGWTHTFNTSCCYFSPL
jgi:cytochrome P450